MKQTYLYDGRFAQKLNAPTPNPKKTCWRGRVMIFVQFDLHTKMRYSRMARARITLEK